MVHSSIRLQHGMVLSYVPVWCQDTSTTVSKSLQEFSNACAVCGGFMQLKQDLDTCCNGTGQYLEDCSRFWSKPYVLY